MARRTKMPRTRLCFCLEPRFQRALLEALLELPSLTPEEFQAMTKRKVQAGSRRAWAERAGQKATAQAGAVAVGEGGSNGVD